MRIARFTTRRRQSPPAAPALRCRCAGRAARARAARLRARCASSASSCVKPPSGPTTTSTRPGRGQQLGRGARAAARARRAPTRRARRRTRRSASNNASNGTALEDLGTRLRPHCCAAAAREAAPARELLRADVASDGAFAVERKKRRTPSSWPSRRRNPSAAFGHGLREVDLAAPARAAPLPAIRSSRVARPTRPIVEDRGRKGAPAESTSAMRSPCRKRSTCAILCASPPAISTVSPASSVPSTKNRRAAVNALAHSGRNASFTRSKKLPFVDRIAARRAHTLRAIRAGVCSACVGTTTCTVT